MEKTKQDFPILGLAGMELTCYTASPMEICFGFVIKTVLVTVMFWLRVDSVCPESRIAFPSPPSRQGVDKGPGGESQGHHTPTDQRNIPNMTEFYQVYRNITNCDI